MRVSWKYYVTVLAVTLFLGWRSSWEEMLMMGIFYGVIIWLLWKKTPKE